MDFTFMSCGGGNDPWPPGHYREPEARGPYCNGDQILQALLAQYGSWESLGKKNREEMCYALLMETCLWDKYEIGQHSQKNPMDLHHGEKIRKLLLVKDL